MALHLNVEVEDKIVMSDGVVIDITEVAGGKVTLSFTAPKDIKINTIFKDSSKQFKNLRKNR